jgi:hypothetical protein
MIYHTKDILHIRKIGLRVRSHHLDRRGGHRIVGVAKNSQRRRSWRKVSAIAVADGVEEQAMCKRTS